MSCLFFIYIDKYIDQYGIICICSFFVLERIAKAIMVIIMSKENISYLDNMLALYGNRVFSIRNAPADAVYIGRGRGSIFGNPFPMHCEADREKVCIEYRKWLADKIKKDPWFREQVKNLKDKKVACFCSNGKRLRKEGARWCHGHILLACAEYLNKE